MIRTISEFGAIVRILRKNENLSQAGLATKCGVNRSMIAHLEQGIRLPAPKYLSKICEILKIDDDEWRHFGDEYSAECVEFERVLTELTGRTLSLHHLEKVSRKVAENNISQFFRGATSDYQKLDLLNRILVSYGVRQISEIFFERFLKGKLTSIDDFESAVTEYQKFSIRLFSTFFEAFVVLNAGEIEKYSSIVEKIDVSHYGERDEWKSTNLIEDKDLSLLGYISIEKIKRESDDRKFLANFLVDLASKIQSDGPSVIVEVSTKDKTRVDSLLRKFESSLPHGLFSPLFAPDPDEIRREAERLAPRTETELERISYIQEIALGNLANYLTADYMDVYIATSMRTEGDYVSVNRFVKQLFDLPKIKTLKLRYFNPTQSWIGDRVAKGLVEALMLKRASVTIYMAQKSDTFGKDSEASVALGQGKTVIVFVPKLVTERFDSEKLFKTERSELERLVIELKMEAPDAGADNESIVAGIISAFLHSMSDDDLCGVVRDIWDDFDLYGEASRFDKDSDNLTKKETYREWLDDVVSIGRAVSKVPQEIKSDVIGILVVTAINFEKRAKVFRVIHPLALQVVINTGVLNGILVVRSVEQCGEVLSKLLKNELDFDLIKEEENYRLIERITQSTVRVISRNRLIRNAFATFYRRPQLHLK